MDSNRRRRRCRRHHGHLATVPARTQAHLTVTWDDLLWAAVTVGRPNWYYVFRHGILSIHEVFFRWSLVRMALEQRDPMSADLCRTSAARALDPTEKGAVSYFLGMVVCKLFATKLLNTPWLLHLDVFRPQLDAVLSGRSRPDLVGQDHELQRWHGFECKGRVNPPGAATKSEAKKQAQRLIRVGDVPCSLHVGAVAYFRGDVLQFYWRDPAPGDLETIGLELPDDPWRHCYDPVARIINDQIGSPRGDWVSDSGVQIEDCDLALYVHRVVAKYLANADWDGALRALLNAGCVWQPAFLSQAGSTTAAPCSATEVVGHRLARERQGGVPRCFVRSFG